MTNEEMSEANDPIVVWHEQAVSRGDRERLNGHRGCVVWLTGLSGCGKSTIANLVDQMLHQRGQGGDRDAVPKRQA